MYIVPGWKNILPKYRYSPQWFIWSHNHKVYDQNRRSPRFLSVLVSELFYCTCNHWWPFAGQLYPSWSRQKRSFAETWWRLSTATWNRLTARGFLAMSVIRRMSSLAISGKLLYSTTRKYSHYTVVIGKQFILRSHVRTCNKCLHIFIDHMTKLAKGKKGQNIVYTFFVCLHMQYFWMKLGI